MTIPKLRFNEFGGEYENYLFSDVTTINPKSKILPDSFIYIDLESVTKGELRKEIRINKNEAPSRAQRLLDKEDILYQTVRPYQKNNYFFNKDEIDYVASTGYAQIRTRNSSRYIYHYIHTSIFVNKVLLRCTGTSYPSINTKDLAKVKLSIPTLIEQQKIASFLTAVDKKITQLQQKEQLLQDYKKGVMQKTFSYEKRLHDSELRKGKLGDFGFFYYGKGAPKTTIIEGAPTPCVRYGELYSTYNDEIKKIKSYTIVDPKNLKLSKGGEVLVPRVGEDPLDFANCSYLPFSNVAIGEMISVYNTKEYGLFMTYYINASLKKQLARMVEGGNVSNLYFRYVEKIEVEIPSIEEQTKIANFLSAIDKKIALVNTQLEHTQQFKKGLLQQMFV